MSASLWWFDVALAGALVALAAVLLTIRDLFAAIVLFIAFGLLVAITWGRLGAVDVALAEAAIGAGLTGALLLGVPADAPSVDRDGPRSARERGRTALTHALVAAPCGGLAIVLGVAVLGGEPSGSRILPRALAELEAAGVEHPVTAVLLSYRAYDTLLELFVLLAAVIGAWAQRLTSEPRAPLANRVLNATARLLLPATVLVGGYLLWLGSHAPGGAFQAGAVLAGGGVLTFFVRSPPHAGRGVAVLRAALCSGVLVFAGLGLAHMAWGEGFLQYRAPHARLVILLIESAAAVGVALALLALFAGRSPADRPEEAG